LTDSYILYLVPIVFHMIPHMEPIRSQLIPLFTITLATF